MWSVQQCPVHWLALPSLQLSTRWDAFANEFFEDEAQLTLTFCLEDGPKRYSKLTETEAVG